MKEFEYHIPPEMGNIQSENVPLKNEVNKYPEFNSVSPEYNSFPEQSGTAGSVRRNGNEDQRTEGSGRSSVRSGGEAFRMFGLAVAAVGIVTVSSVLSGGSFFPELGNAATALADMLDRPAVTSQEGIPIPELIAAWNEEQDPEPDDLYIPGTSEPDEEPDGTDDELLTVQSGDKEQSADSNASLEEIYSDNDDRPAGNGQPDIPDSPGQNGTAEDPEQSEPHVHSYTWTTITEAGCETEGEREGLCSCGETVKESIAALGHDFSAGYNAGNSDNTRHWQICSRCGAQGNTAEHSRPGSGQYETGYLTHGWTCAECGRTLSEEHTFDADSTCTICGFVSPVSGEQSVAPGIQANGSLESGWFIHTAYFRLWVDTTRIPDVEVEVEPGSGWTLMNGQTGVNKGSLTAADPYVLVSFGLVPDDPAQIVAGEKYTYTVVVRYNGEEIRREKWSLTLNEIADPITNSTITVTKEG